MQRLAVLAALLGALCLATAARMPEELHVFDADLSDSLASMNGPSSVLARLTGGKDDIQLEGGFTVGSGNLANDLEALLVEPELQKKEKWPIRIVTKHLVKPDLHGAFVRNFWRLQYKTQDVKGLKYLSLSKVAGDNVVWTSYTVVEGFDGLIKLARSEGVRDFAGYLTTANIPVRTKLLFRIAGGYHGASNAAGEAAVDKAVAVKDLAKPKHGWPVRLVTAYIVRPGEHCAFVKAWKKMEEKIGGTKGNIALSLNKPAGDNLVFVSYSAWESPADLWDAVKSKAVHEFAEYIADNHITEVTKRLFKVPHPKW